MYEMMKWKYRKLISNLDNLEIVEQVLTDLQSTLIKNDFYNEEELIRKIIILKEKENSLFCVLLQDIRNKKLLESMD